jgi:uncharacterized protein (TIGR02246 family)
MNALTADDRLKIDSIVADIANAWNASDSTAFSVHFASDATQINIYGKELLGAEQIREQHDRIFNTIFKNSRNTLRVVDAGYASQEIVIARVSSTVEVPQGPLKGDLRTLGSLVLRRSSAGWQIVLFHNTRVEMPPQPKNDKDQ